MKKLLTGLHVIHNVCVHLNRVLAYTMYSYYTVPKLCRRHCYMQYIAKNIQKLANLRMQLHWLTVDPFQLHQTHLAKYYRPHPQATSCGISY